MIRTMQFSLPEGGYVQLQWPDEITVESVDMAIELIALQLAQVRRRAAAAGVETPAAPDNIRAFLYALQERNAKDNGLFPQVASEVEADDKALRRVLALLDFYHPPRTCGVPVWPDGACFVDAEGSYYNDKAEPLAAGVQPSRKPEDPYGY